MSEQTITQKTITMRAGDLGFAIQAFGEFQGRKSVMLAWRIGQILQVLRTMQSAFIENVRPFVDEQGEMLKDADEAALVELCEEQVSFAVEPLRLADLSELTIEDPDALLLLKRLGLVCACPSSS